MRIKERYKSVFIFLTFFAGFIFGCFLSGANYSHYESDLAAAKDEINRLKKENNTYRVAGNFNDLFVLLASPTQMVDMKDLNAYLKKKRALYWEVK